MTRPTNRKLRVGLPMEPAAVILEAVGVTENKGVACAAAMGGQPIALCGKMAIFEIPSIRARLDAPLARRGQGGSNAPSRPALRSLEASE